MEPAPGPSRFTGLSEAEAVARRRAGQGNLVQPSAGRSYLRILADGAFAPVNLVLFATCLVLAWLGLVVDAAVTSIPVLLNVVASVALEAIAKRRLDRLAILSRPLALVIRDGRERAVRPTELVLGDLLVVTRGDQVMLDGVVEDGALELDEALLTGESDPVARGAGTPVLSGSACVGGHGLVRVTRVGAASYANQLVLRARETRTERTPLQRDLARLVGGSAALVLVVGLVVAIDFSGAGALITREAVQAAAVLVAIVPQGLVIIVTLLYASAAVSISRSGALVQRINAVESMSRVDTLVLDKTGTLTTGRLRLARIWAAGADGDTGGDVDAAADDGAAAHGDAGGAHRLLAAMAAEPSFTDRTTLAIRAWLGATATPAPAPGVTTSVPFSSDRRWSGVQTSGGAAILGAPDALLAADAAEALLAADSAAARSILARAEAWAAEGLRVLLVAAAPGLPVTPGVLPAGLRPAALLGFREELRGDAAATLKALTEAGLRLKVASGDHRSTVGTIAASVGVQGEASDGRALADLDDAALGEAADRGTIFGRVEPALKARLVRALRARGHDVAMVGDGVNDIIALREANLGLAMESGSAAARAAADVVLLGDSFAVLPKAVVAGQRIVEGMRLVACLLFTRTVYALLLVLGASICGLDFPLTPRTNSVLALITVGIPTLVLAAWAPAGRSGTPLFRSALRFAIPAGIAVAAFGLAVFAAWSGSAGGVAEARTALSAVTLWCGILVIPLLLPPGRGRDARPTLLAVAMLVLFAVVLLVPGLRNLFDLTTLPPADTGALALLTAAWGLAVFKIRSMRLVARLLVAVRRR